jgi:hypothetical protein
MKTRTFSLMVLVLLLALMVGATACGSSSKSSGSHPAVDDDNDTSGGDDNDDNDTADDDTSPGDDDSATPTCQSVYDEFYNTCGFDFTTAGGAAIPEATIVAACNIGQPCYELSGTIANCIIDDTGDCSTMEACVAAALPCGDDDDDSSPDDDDDNDDNDNDDNDASPSWSPSVFSEEVLWGVWGTSSADVWAVGGLPDPTDNYVGTAGYIDHYDGARFTTFFTTSDAEMFTGVWGTSPSDVYAVGSTFAGEVVSHGAVWHYDGNSWSEWTTGDAVTWQGVWGASSTDVFTAGYDQTQNIMDVNQGSVGGWTTMANASGIEPELFAIWGDAPTNAYAVGTSDIGLAGAGVIMHTNGSTWTEQFSTPGPAILYGFWGHSTAYAVGTDTLANTALIYHGAGGTWTAMDPQDGDLVSLYSVWGTSESSIYTVGADFTGSSAAILHYDGSAWSPMAVPNDSAAILGGVWGVSDSDVWAVGVSAGTLNGVIMHYGN